MNDDYLQQTDEALCLLLQQGNERPFEILMDRYGPKLLRYGKKFLSSRDNVEDIVQEVFIKVYQNIQSFDTTQRFSPWIYRIAHNSFVNRLRTIDKEPLLSFNFDTLVEHSIYEDPMIAEKEKEELRVLVNKGLDTLSPIYREVVTLHYFENFSYQEIADILHIPIGTVGIRLRRARETLKKAMQYE